MKIENYKVSGSRVKFACPHCGAKLVTKLKQAGTQDSCPECGGTFTCAGRQELHEFFLRKSRSKKDATSERSGNKRESLANECSRTLLSLEHSLLYVVNQVSNLEKSKNQSKTNLKRLGCYEIIKRNEEKYQLFGPPKGVVLDLFVSSVQTLFSYDPCQTGMSWGIKNAIRNEGFKNRKAAWVAAGKSTEFELLTPEMQAGLSLVETADNHIIYYNARAERIRGAIKDIKTYQRWWRIGGRLMFYWNKRHFESIIQETA